MDMDKYKKKIIDLELRLQFHKEYIKYGRDFRGYDEYVISDATEKLFQKYKDLNIIENPISEEEYMQYITDNVIPDLTFDSLFVNRKRSSKRSSKLKEIEKEFEKEFERL